MPLPPSHSATPKDATLWKLSLDEARAIIGLFSTEDRIEALAEVFYKQKTQSPDDVAFSNDMNALMAYFGSAFKPFVSDTERQVLDHMKEMATDNTPPNAVNPWECRIGLSRFIIPPLNINVSRVGRAGAVGSGLRQASSPKFNSGHSETVISMTLYFPTHESIWGFPGASLDIDFDSADPQVVDSFASSLRGLIAQFKYAPFLPIKNQYINQTYGITGVAMNSMSVSTIENYPFCLAVQLDLFEFNHKVFLPMIEDFDQAIHWGRFRQYVGRAATKLSDTASKGFLTNDISLSQFENLQTQQTEDQLLAQARDIISESYTQPKISHFDKLRDWDQGKGFGLYFPAKTPVNIIYPDLTNFRARGDIIVNRKGRDWWQSLMGTMGFPFAADSEASYEATSRYFGPSNIGYLLDEKRLLVEFTKSVGLNFNQMDPSQLEDYLNVRLTDYQRTHPEVSTGELVELRSKVKQVWFATIYEGFIKDPYLSNIFETQELLRDFLLIKEWEVPMQQLTLDPNNVVVNGISVSMGNNYARLQLQLHEEPTHQHLGGLDTRADIHMTIFGETELAKFRIVWDQINSLARLEHGHGVLGFMGIKNVVTALCGMKYAMMESFEVDTIPNMPHVYDVRLSLIDFDVFQQKREILSSEQQAELIDAFSKRNPFLRIKQRWSAFNAYPDFPLTIRDEAGAIVGNLDPDFYFHAFETIDTDDVDFTDGYDTPINHVLMQGGAPSDASTTTAVGGVVSGEMIEVSNKGVRERREGFFGDYLSWWEANADQFKIFASVPGMTPLGNYMNPYKGGAGDPTENFQHMLQDAKFRDKGGRMIRAFPTYMLWLIDEGGKYSGIKLYDNFYGLQSVVDIAVGASEDAMSDTLILQVSNLYSRLSTPYRNLVDESIYGNAAIINTQLNRSRNLASGLTDYLVTLETVDLKAGVRIHLRLGYSANPNALDTVFNGVVTNVEQGEVITITAQSDAVELSQIINNDNSKGHTGTIDGAAMSGLWLSEPRDLMIRLLSMGATTTKEQIANATQGRIFSENRFGIRHFGTMVYDQMTPTEQSLQGFKDQVIDSSISNIAKISDPADLSGGTAGALNVGVVDAFFTMSMNSFKKRDYEIFKRNIYPGNGTGISQYTGGDFGDGGVALAFGATGVGVDGNIVDPLNGAPRSAEDITGVKAAQESGIAPGDYTGPNSNPFHPVKSFKNFTHPFAELLGISSKVGDDDITGADEVSMRATTYMKTVWDMFELCAALLPNYIIAVRPFEDRSTIFYGKPHWLYTSGLIPLSTGVTDADGPSFEKPNADLLSILDKVHSDLELEKENDQTFYDRLSQTVSGNPSGSTAGMIWNGGDVGSLPLTATGITGSGLATIPYRKTGVAMEMHLPTDGTLATDVSQHRQTALPIEYSHPYYMDRAKYSDDGSGKIVEELGRGGYVSPRTSYDSSKSVLDEPGNLPGRYGAFGFLDAASEQYYCVQPWPDKGPLRDIAGKRGKKIMVFNTRTQKGCITTPGDWGPNVSVTGAALAGGISPDGAFAIDLKHGDECYFGFVDDNAPLGPVVFNATNTSSTTGLPSASQAGGSGASAGVGGNSGTSGGGGAVVFGPGGGNAVSKTSPSGDIQYPPTINGEAMSELKSVMGDQGYTDIRQIAYKYGWQVAHFPIDYTDTQSGWIDEMGRKAHEVYTAHVSDEKAQEVWNEFRMDFRDEQTSKDIFNRYFPGQSDATRNAVFDEFQRYMWQNAYHRGWLALTADASFTLGTAITGDTAEIGNFLSRAGDATGIPGAGLPGQLIAGTSNLVGEGIDQVTGFITDPVGKLGDLFGGGDSSWLTNSMGLQGDGGASKSSGNHYDWDNARKVFELWLVDPDKAKQFMIENNSPGKTHSGIFARGAEEFYTKIWSNAGDVLGSLGSAIGAAAGGILDLMRLSTMNLTQGIAQATYNQRMANAINRSFNDSLYYQAGPPGTLMQLADNPFTREYGEPVIEVRQPFQRLHLLNSFRNIISNGIQENLDGVATVITATSQGKDPVTVHLDKDAPAERQIEKAVETGLIFDQPGGVMDVLNAPLHPVNTMRGFAKWWTGADDSTMAKRVALYHLRESIKDIYGGEIIILGDASIRPFDLIYLGDVYTGMYGICEVERVVHHFNAEMGFVTSITPNALVTVLDPPRWSMMSFIRGRLNTWNLRHDMRHIFRPNGARTRFGLPEQITHRELANTMQAQLLGGIEFTGGNGALVTDLQAMKVTGQLVPNSFFNAAANRTNNDPIQAPGGGGQGAQPLGPESSNPLTAILGGIADAWNPWNVVKSKLLDQQSCYIQYLTRNGQPMDSNLQSNRGIAVGQQRTSTLFKNSLRLQLPFEDTNGNSRIATNDLLNQIGWTPKQIDNLIQDLDLETNLIKSRILDMSGRGDEGTVNGNVESYIVHVDRVIDGDTIIVSPAINGYNSIRLAGIDSPEVAHKNLASHGNDLVDENLADLEAAEALTPQDPGVLAWRYTWDALYGKTVVIRVSSDHPLDNRKARVLGWIFTHVEDENMSEQDRINLLHSYSQDYPLVSWDSYLSDGVPYTFNWQLVITGHANVYLFRFDQQLPNQGVDGPFIGTSPDDD
jgi:endonuclease YncB( thermonuclease family)